MSQQHTRNKVVLERLLAYYEDEPDVLAEELERFLNALACQDAFGPERQWDPRGDCRDYDFDMCDVEGVDV